MPFLKLAFAIEYFLLLTKQPIRVNSKSWFFSLVFTASCSKILFFFVTRHKTLCFILSPVQEHFGHLKGSPSIQLKIYLLAWKFKTFRKCKLSKSLEKLGLKIRCVDIRVSELWFLKLCLTNMFIHYVVQIKAISCSCIAILSFIIIISFLMFNLNITTMTFLIQGVIDYLDNILAANKSGPWWVPTIKNRCLSAYYTNLSLFILTTLLWEQLLFPFYKWGKLRFRDFEWLALAHKCKLWFLTCLSDSKALVSLTNQEGAN